MPTISNWQIIADLIWLFFLLFLMGSLLRNLRTLRRKKKLWQKTHGRITQVEWVEIGHSLWPEVTYQFEVLNQEYVGDRYFFTEAHQSLHAQNARDFAYKIVQNFTSEDTIDVYYDPIDPHQSVLNPQAKGRLGLFIGLLSLLLGTHLLVMGYHLWY